MATQYATKEQLKTYLVDNPDVVTGTGIVAGAVTYDALLDTILQRVSAWIERKAQRVFTQTAELRYFDGNGMKRLFGNGGPFDLISATSVEVLSDGSNGTAWVAVPAGDYVLQPANRLAGLPAKWIEIVDRTTGSITVFIAGFKTVRVNGSWGFAATPLEVEQMCLSLAVRTWRARGAGFGDAIGLSSDAIDQLIITKAVSAMDYETLKSIRHKWVFA